MASWKKEFGRWKSAKDVIDKNEVEAILRRIFKERFAASTAGGSHELRISLPELHEYPKFEGGHLSIPVTGGRHVKVFYIKRVLLALETLTNDCQLDLVAIASGSDAADEDDDKI